MPFPKKSYFSLSEVSARWRRKIKDVEYCIENGLLRTHNISKTNKGFINGKYGRKA